MFNVTADMQSVLRAADSHIKLGVGHSVTASPGESPFGQLSVANVLLVPTCQKHSATTKQSQIASLLGDLSIRC